MKMAPLVSPEAPLGHRQGATSLSQATSKPSPSHFEVPVSLSNLDNPSSSATSSTTYIQAAAFTTAPIPLSTTPSCASRAPCHGDNLKSTTPQLMQQKQHSPVTHDASVSLFLQNSARTTDFSNFLGPCDSLLPLTRREHVSFKFKNRRKIAKTRRSAPRP